jgi:hypothetical protein
MSAPRQSYALLAGSTPKAPKKYLPWADAVVSVGRSMYPDDWDDAELALSDYNLTDRVAAITAISKVENPEVAARAQLAAMNAKLDGLGQRGMWSDPKSEAARRDAEAPLVGEVRAVRQAISDRLPALTALKSQNDQRKIKLQGALEALSDALLEGAVAAYWYREGSTSPPTALSVGQFMAARENAGFNLFVCGRIESNYKQHHVYVDAEQLATTFPKMAGPVKSVGTIQLDDLSPYLRLLIGVSQEQGISEENKSNPDSLALDLLAAAPRYGLTVGAGNDGSDISQTWAKQLAKAMRWPNARLGQAAGKTLKS